MVVNPFLRMDTKLWTNTVLRFALIFHHKPQHTQEVKHDNKLSPGGLRQFTLSPVRDYDRTQELGLTLLGRVPMPASYPHRASSLVYL